MLTEKIQLEPDEKILIQVRKHWFILTTQLLSVFVLAVIPIILYMIINESKVFDTTSLVSNTPLLVSFYSAWLLLIWMALFNVWTNYYLDIWTITNKRLIAVDQRGLFYRNTGSFRLERLQDINISIRGIVATLLDYGDLQAETASDDREFVARNIPKPQELKALILSAADSITFNNYDQKHTTAAAPHEVNDGL